MRVRIFKYKLILIILVLAICFIRSKAANIKVINDSKIAETEYFEFHSNYFLNLHHYLLMKGSQYARGKTEFDSLFVDEGSPNPDSKTKEKIMLAVKYYSDSISSRNMLFDEELNTAKYAMEQSSTFDELESKVLLKEMITEMKSLNNFYSTYIWTKVNQQNIDFVNAQLLTVKKIEVNVMKEFKRVYGYDFTGKKFRIDLIDYAGFFGAYTTNEPYINACISSGYKRHTGSQGTEVIFHEVSHGMIQKIFETQKEVCDQFNIKFDHNTWHTILFYSTGKIVKNELKKAGIDHELYIYKNKLADLNASFKKGIEKTELYWGAFMNGKTEMKTAIEGILVD